MYSAQDIATARQTVGKISALIARRAERLVENGASEDHALMVATADVLGAMAAQRPTAFGAYVRSLLVLDTAL